MALLVAAACSCSRQARQPSHVARRARPSRRASERESPASVRAKARRRGGGRRRSHRRGPASRSGRARCGALRRPAGWGERIFGNGNDWEPATAADPGAPYVYVLTTRYSGRGPLPCDHCDIPGDGVEGLRATVARPSGTSATSRPIGPGGQYDPQIATDAAGDVFAAWINGGFRIVFSQIDRSRADVDASRSSCSTPAGWADHPWLGVSPSGQHVCIAFNHAASWVTCSHDGGVTWPGAVQISTQERYYYANGDVVHDDGAVVDRRTRATSLHSGYHGNITVVVSRSADGGHLDQRGRRHRGRAAPLREPRVPARPLRRPVRARQRRGRRPGPRVRRRDPAAAAPSTSGCGTPRTAA